MTEGASSASGAVLVTGATGGIGRAVVERLVARGAVVVASGRDAARLAELARAGGGRILPLAADLGADGEPERLVSGAFDLAGTLDGLVLCAGIARHAFVGGITRADLDLQLAVNVVAPILIAQGFAERLVARGRGGSVVIVASTLGLRPARGTLGYSASKAALVSATRTLAAELAPHAIRVNAVAPGVIDTEMARVPRLRPGEARPSGEALRARVEAEVEALRSLHPLGRLGRPEEVALAVVELLDATWSTGTVQVVDGGLLAV